MSSFDKATLLLNKQIELLENPGKTWIYEHTLNDMLTWCSENPDSSTEDFTAQMTARKTYWTERFENEILPERLAVFEQFLDEKVSRELLDAVYSQES